MDEKGPEEAGLPQSEQGPQGGRASAFTLYHISRPRSGVTGDALYCQRTLCRQIRRASGHYLFVIKANQPELLEEVGLLFAVPPPGEQFATAASRRRRRDRYEERILTVSTALAAYVRELGWD